MPIETHGHEGFMAIDLATGEEQKLLHFVRDVERFPLGNNPRGWVAVGRAGDQPTITIWAGAGLTVAQPFVLELETGTVGASLPWGARGAGRFSVKGDDGIEVRDLTTGEVVATAPFEEGEGIRGPGAYDPTSRVVAGAVSDSRVGVWDASGARELTLPGHRGSRAMWLATGGETLLVQDRSLYRIWDLTRS